MSAKSVAQKNGRVHLLEVRARNVQCVKEVAISLDGAIHEIRGDTGQGKTTILKTIEAGLRGMDPAMVRNGESTAEIELTLTDAVIKRIVPREGKERLMVTGSDGHPVQKAAEFLKALCGPTAFRPVEWVRLADGDGKGKTDRLRRQRDQLLEAIPMALTAKEVAAAVRDLGEDHMEALADVHLGDVDFDQHAFIACSALERACYDHRKSLNDRAKEAEARVQLVPAPDRAAPRASLAELEAAAERAKRAYYAAEARQGNQQALRQRRQALAARIASEAADLPDRNRLDHTAKLYRDEAESLEKDIAHLEATLEAKRKGLQEARLKLRRCSELEDALDAHEARRNDLAALDKELAQDADGEDIGLLEATLQEALADVECRRLQDTHDEAVRQAQTCRRQAEVFDALVRLFRDALPKSLLEAADLPVEGLGIEGDLVTIGGVPLHQLGTSEQIRVGVMIASALNPRSGFVLVDGAESLGSKDRAALAEAARDLDLQLLLTYVDPTAQPGPHTTVMRAGEAVEV